MPRKKGFAISAIDLRTGKRKVFPKRFRKKSTAQEFAEDSARNERRLKLSPRRRRVVSAVGQRRIS